MKLHRFRSWVHSTDPLFDQRMSDIVGRYINPPQGEFIYCIDERTGMQALEQFEPDWLSCGSRQSHVAFPNWGDFKSLTHLERAVMEFIGYHNQHDAKPYRWTYTGQPGAI